jgi:TolB-like protein
MEMKRWLYIGSIVLSITFLGLGCAHLAVPAGEKKEGSKLALLPLDNFTGNHQQDVKEIIAVLKRKIMAKGYELLEDDKLEAFLRRYRIRRTGFINPQIARLMGRELGVDLVLEGSLDLFASPPRPQLSMTLRAISANEGDFLWSGNVAKAGEDFTTFFGVGTITSMEELSERVAEDLLSQLGESLSSGIRKPVFSPASYRGKPYVYFQKGFELPEAERVAVLPFFNVTSKKEAGLIAANLIVAKLLHSDRVKVTSPGEVIDAMSGILNGMGSSEHLPLDNLRVLGRRLQVKAIITGTVDVYQEGLNNRMQNPKVEVYVRMLNAETGSLLWSSWNGRKGDDSVIFLDFGLIRPVVKVLDKCVGEMLARLVAYPG